MNRKKLKNPLLFGFARGIAGVISVLLFPAPYFMTRGKDFNSFLLILFYILLPFLSSIFARVMIRVFDLEEEDKSVWWSLFYIVWPIWAIMIIGYQIFSFNSFLGDKIADKLTQNSKEVKMLEYEKLRLELKEMGVEV